MFSRMMSELLAAFLIGLSSMRFLYAKRIQFDILSVLPLAALIISVLSFTAFGFSITGAALTAIGFLSFLWNLRYLVRLSNHLFLDHFSTWFVVTGIINTILCLIIVIYTVALRPVSIPFKSQGIYQYKTYYTGSFQDGFTEAQPFQKRTATLFKFEKYVKPYQDSIAEMRAQAEIIKLEEKGEEAPLDLLEKAFSSHQTQIPYEKKGTIFLLPNKCTSVDDYLPFIYEFVQNGYTVYSAEFFTDDLNWFNDYRDLRIFRRSAFLMRNLDKSRQIEAQKDNESHRDDFIKEIKAMIELADVNDDLYRFVLGDKDSDKAIQLFHSSNPEFMSSCYDLAVIESYMTPGYGQISQMRPMLARNFGISRDPSMDNTKEIVSTCETELIFQAKINALQKIQETTIMEEQNQQDVVLPEDQLLQIEEFQIENQFDMTGLE